MPSARVRITGSAVGACAISDGGHAAAPSACTPTTRTPSGTAAATPPSRPPPPVGTSTVATSGHCSTISSPTVPWPAITSTWSNGCTSTAPVRSANAHACARLSSTVAPTRCTVAPYPRVASTLGSAARSGMNTVARTPSVCAASATPCAWLPALAATTPRARCPASSRAIRVYAPRILNDPVRCRFSHFSSTGPPHSSLSAREFAMGVGATTPASSSRAARTSAGPTGGAAAGRTGCVTVICAVCQRCR